MIEPTPLEEAISSPTFIGGNNISCFGASDGAVNLLINGGSPNYSYTWSNGAVTQNISGLTVGVYDVTVTDVNGCQITSSITLTEPTPLAYTLQISSYAGGFNVTGCQNDGTIDLGVSGSIPGYSYSWSNGSPTQDINNLFAGDYTVTITDANGCTLVVDTTLVAAPVVITAASVVTNYNGQDISCFGASDGGITVLPSGGVPAYTYQWSVPGNPNLSTAQSPSGLPAGTYTVVVTDQNGCPSSTTVTLVNPPQFVFNLAVSTNYNGQDISCFGAADGGIDLSVSGATPAYSYVWTNALGSTVSTNQDPNGLPAGVYTVQTTDANGCTFISSISLSEPLPLLGVADVTSNYNGEDVSCFNFTDGSLTVVSNGGTPGYNYQWSTQGGVNLGVGVDQNNIGAGIYQVLITDVNGCSFIAPVVVTQPTELILAPIILSNYFGQAVSCEGATDGIVNAFVAGGTPTYGFLWTTTPPSTAQNLNDLGTGTYTVTVTDLNGCAASGTVILTANPNPITDLPQPVIGCIGSPITIDPNVPDGTNCQWIFSDGTVINECGPFTLSYDSQVCLDVQYVVSTTIGCIDTVMMTDFICISPNPVASFTMSDYEISSTDFDAFFYNNSQGADTYYWDFGDNTNSIEENPYHQFPQTGYDNFLIWLYAYNEFGCVDSTLRYITMVEDLIIYVPNTFTPDYDEFNNTFFPVLSSGFNPQNYRLYIFNRWGELIFESRDHTVGWDGTYNGERCQVGTYVWKIVTMDSQNDRKREFVGHVNLIR